MGCSRCEPTLGTCQSSGVCPNGLSSADPAEAFAHLVVTDPARFGAVGFELLDVGRANDIEIHDFTFYFGGTASLRRGEFLGQSVAVANDRASVIFDIASEVQYLS